MWPDKLDRDGNRIEDNSELRSAISRRCSIIRMDVDDGFDEQIDTVMASY